jgi:tetratricopeptide (TPR) repeat protein
VLYLTGQIATADGSPIPHDVVVERMCNGSVRQQVHASPGGDFSMQMGSMIDSFLDASAGSPTDLDSQYAVTGRPSQNRMLGMGIPRRELFNCELRASVPGFRSSVVGLMEFQPSVGSIDVGSIVVQRSAKIEGTMVSATIYQAPKDARKAYEKGLQAERKGKFADARSYFEKAVQIYPRHADAWFQLGAVLLTQNQKDEARAAYTQATSADSRFLPPYLLLALMAGEAENWTEVVNLTGQILDRDPLNYPDAYFYNSVANYNLKKMEEAKKSGLQAERLDQRNRFPQLHLLLAEIFAQKNDYASAISEMQTYLKVAPTVKSADQVRERIAEFEKLKAAASTSEKLDAHGLGSIKVTIQARPADTEDAASEAALAALSPKAHKEMGKALVALRAKKPADAQSHLEAAYRLEPKNAEVNYIFGVYSSQLNKKEEAQSYWEKTLELDPTHVSALLALSNLLLREKKPAEAQPYLDRAMEAEPSSWRVHALLAEALLMQGSSQEAIEHGQRALELGHSRAAAVAPLLARAFAERGDTDKAIGILHDYVKEHPEDTAASVQLERLQSPAKARAASDEKALNEIAAMTWAALPIPSNWLPPDVDEQVPPVERGAACVLDDVLEKAGKRVQEFVTNVDRFTATEMLKHETINKWGFAGSPETRKFEYMVSVEEVRPGDLKVEEYRRTFQDFPDGVATIGFPAQALIFHPYNASHFEMTCEGLGRWNGTPAWQVHFRQRSDKPNTTRAYRLNAATYLVALKGRAWIDAYSYQILRLETHSIAPIPEIRLVEDHTIVEYGPVHFREGKVDLWLPQSAEVYYDWRGRRSHRRHSFSNYLLFSVADKQHISTPKTEDEASSKPATQTQIPNP